MNASNIETAAVPTNAVAAPIKGVPNYCFIMQDVLVAAAIKPRLRVCPARIPPRLNGRGYKRRIFRISLKARCVCASDTISPRVDARGYDVRGYNVRGYNVRGYNVRGDDVRGYDARGYNMGASRSKNSGGLC